MNRQNRTQTDPLYEPGHAGDAANAILTAVGHNFRRILAWMRELLRSIFHALLPALIGQRSSIRILNDRLSR
jgi:transposase, IS5 family